MSSEEKTEGIVQNYYESPVHKKLFQKVKEISSTLTTFREDSSVQPTFKSFNPNGILGQFSSENEGLGSISAIQSIFEENETSAMMIAFPADHPNHIQKKQSRYFEQNSSLKEETDFT